MREFFDTLSYPVLMIAVTGMVAFRYFFFAGIMDFSLRVLFRKTVAHRRIQSTFPNRSDIQRELVYSGLTILIVGVVGFGMQYATRKGWTMIYGDLSKYGLPYAAFSLGLLLVLHDTYFYWAHRLMHHPKLYRMLHIIHHRSRNPSPWAALAMQPAEALLQAAFIPVAIFAFPVHANVVLLFVVLMMWMNTLGHSGYEIYPRGFSRGTWTWWNNTSVHHNMHHSHIHCNYGLYFNWWDRLMGTNHPSYHDFFDAVTAEPLLLNQTAAERARLREEADGAFADFRDPAGRTTVEAILP